MRLLDPVTASSPIFGDQTPVVPMRGVHLDLKGLAPTFDRLMQLVDVFGQMRFNVLLVEWEDMFPWTFDDRLSHPDAYTPQQVRAFRDRCAALKMQFIPLIPTLGHMEFVLKHPGYESLREIPDRVDCLNPLADGAQQLVQKMIDDQLAILGDLSYLHLGGDEAWGWAKHPDTSAYVHEKGSASLYLRHYQPLFDKLAGHNIRPMLWHDMMSDWPTESLQHIGKQAEIVIWGYRGKPQQELHHHKPHVLRAFADAGVSIWGGGCFKGADGPSCDLPLTQARLDNHQGWVQATLDYALQGVITTGWSRYAHSRCQVEPLDACLLELAMTALCFHHGGSVTEKDAWDLLDQCHQTQLCKTLREHLRQLNDARNIFWERSRQMMEHLAAGQVEPALNDSGFVSFLMDHLNPWANRVTALTEQLPALLHGSVVKSQADAYARTWDQSVRNQLALLEQQIQNQFA
ncbi:MAG: family 20 glycosylhydrolase [Phycisphaeraceae bacterium JB051]